MQETKWQETWNSGHLEIKSDLSDFSASIRLNQRLTFRCQLISLLMRITHWYYQFFVKICCEIQKFCEKLRTFVICYSSTNTFLFLKTDGGAKKQMSEKWLFLWNPFRFVRFGSTKALKSLSGIMLFKLACDVYIDNITNYVIIVTTCIIDNYYKWL